MPGDRRIDDWLRSQIDAGHFPGAAYLVGTPDRVLASGAAGRAVLAPEERPAHADTIYDLASLTKPLASALLALKLRERGCLALDDPLARHLDGWRPADDRSLVTLLDLFTHRAGLKAWDPLYIGGSGRDALLARIQAIPAISPAGRRVTYSDLGYILIGFALEAAGGRPLDRLFAQEIAGPLGLTDLLYRPAEALRPRIAATEAGNERERQLAGARAPGYNAWRTGMIWGEVHDGNAHALGGVAGHAGLFGSCRAVYAVAREILPGRGRLLPTVGRDVLWSNFTPDMEEHRSVGFQIGSTPGSASGPALSERSIGHSGFTGTSLWIDPEAERIFILLTNRVHPRYAPIDMNAIRREFHQVATAL